MNKLPALPNISKMPRLPSLGKVSVRQVCNSSFCNQALANFAPIEALLPLWITLVW